MRRSRAPSADRGSREESLREANRRLEEEIQQHRKTEDALRFAIRELDHRVKNTLATVQAVADQTVRTSTTMSEFSEAFYGRIQAIARIHTALAVRRWEGLTLTELIELVVGPYRHHAGSVAVECDGTFVSSELVRVLGMALHELATNAAKYGALSTKDGRVAISSRLDSNGADRLRICWSEHAGPPVRQPLHRGFGMKLIEEALAYETEGDVTLRFLPVGVRCEIQLPVPRGPGMSTLSLGGASMLIVEDNFVVADALRYLIDGYGGSVSAIVPTRAARPRGARRRPRGRRRARHQPERGERGAARGPPPRARRSLRLPERLRRRGAAARAPAQPPPVRQAGRGERLVGALLQLTRRDSEP